MDKELTGKALADRITSNLVSATQGLGQLENACSTVGMTELSASIRRFRFLLGVTEMDFAAYRKEKKK